MHMTQETPSVPVSIIAEQVFKWWDYFLYIPLTALRVSTIIYFLIYWFSFNDWSSYTLSFSSLTLIILAYISIDQLRWCALPFMKRPRPMAPRAGWKVGVATTFVPGVESLEMLEETVKALMNLHYPHDTWVLDEGDDDQVKTLCLRLGANHFSRGKVPHYQTDNSHFQRGSKHGNYNAWLCEIGFERYDIITAFDPDHVPDPAFLSHVLGYFEDPQVAFVQVAQAYYNQNASFISRGAAEETYGYYSSTLMASYGMGHPIVVGCHNTHRVIALKQVGGFAPHDADDLLISLFYQRQGWQGVYIPQILARGLTPVDWNGYLTQQRRWARSVLDIKCRLYPKLAGGLSFKDRLLSLFQGIGYLHGILVPMALIQLVFMLITGTIPTIFSLSTVSKIFTLYLVLQICNLYRQRFYIDLRNEWGLHWRVILLQLAKWPFLLMAMYDVVTGRFVQYVITEKVRSPSHNFLLIWPNVLIIVVLSFSWIIGTASHALKPVLHISVFTTIVISLCLISTEFLSYPEPFDKKILKTNLNRQ
jgi:cellulose synthase (UDP-forming)